jgi:hypothetical protein
MEELEGRIVPTLLGQQLLPLDNAWNQDISSAPVAANSAAIIAHIGASTRVTPNWTADNPALGSSPLYGIPYNIVHGNSTAKVNVLIDNYPGESDMVPVPIPAGAVLQGDFQDGPNPNGGGYDPNQRGDSHLIVWDDDNNLSYELYGVTRPGDTTLFPNTANVELPHTDGMWHAAQETVWDMKTDSFRTLGETSADAAGLSILAGLARPDEGLPVAQGGQGVINHALRVTLPSGDINPQYIYPASHMVPTTQSPDQLPLGSRLRLANTPAIDSLINTMPAESQTLARAMQQYGLIVADVGNAMYVSGAPASVDANNSINLTWDLTDIFAANGLEALNAGDFQVVNLTPVVTGLSVSSGPAGSSVIVHGQNFSGAAGHLSVFFGGTPAGSVTVLSDTQLSVNVPSGSGTVEVTVQSGVNETDLLSSSPNANVNAPIFGYGTSAASPAELFTFTTKLPPPATVYVDPSFTGPTGSDPATDPGLGLQVGVNAFSTVSAALGNVGSGGTLVLFGGTSSDASVNINVPLGLIEVSQNPGDSPVLPGVTIGGAISNVVQLKVDAATGLTLSGACSFSGPVTLAGTLTVNGTLAAQSVTLQKSKATDPSPILSGSGSVLAPVVVTAAGALVSGVSILAAGGTGIDVQPGASSVEINAVTVNNSTVGIVLEAGSGNSTSITGSTLASNLIALEALNGCILATENVLGGASGQGNDVGVYLPATNPSDPALPVDPLLTLEGNTITWNGTAMANATSMGVTAQFNWWGNSAGPGPVDALGRDPVLGVNVNDYTPYALDATSAGPNPTTLHFFNGAGSDGNVYVTGTLGADNLLAQVDSVNANLIHVSGPVSGNYTRGGTGNRLIVYGLGDNLPGTHDSITVSGSWNAEIHSAALTYREPVTFGGLSSTTLTTLGSGSDVIFGGGNDNLNAGTSGNNVLVAGLSTGKTGSPTAPRLSSGNGANLFLGGFVDCTLAPLAPSGRLDYATLRSMDDLWAAGTGGGADAMTAAALFSVASTPGAILTGTARATLSGGPGKNWYIVKGASNPVNTPSGLNADYVLGSTASPSYRQAIQ